MERALASIRRISAIEPIKDADRIELCRVDGWQVVAGKGCFKPGDLAMYFEVDSFLPLQPRYSILPKDCIRKMESDEGYRIRSVKLRGVVSQGLLLPLELFTDEIKSIPTFMDKEGVDMTDILGVRKYEQPLPACLSGTAKGVLPHWVRKTDEERLQNVPDYFEYYKDMEFEVSMKMDGSSCTYYLRNGHFGVCSRNLDLEETPENTFWQLARQLKIEDKMRYMVDNSSGIVRSFAIQGEVCGPGIQSNREQLESKNFFLFNVWDIDKQEMLGYTMRKMVHEMMNMCIPEIRIEHVPVLVIEQVLRNHPDMNSMIAYADGAGLKNDCREGIVCKSCDGRTSFKVINNRYLLKHGE